MPSFLGDYRGCAPRRQSDFLRAINSVLNQSYKNYELIIVSDGCEITNRHYLRWKFKRNQEVHLVQIEKQPLFSGAVRQAGLDAATGDVACYLDTDDFFNRDHLAIIASSFIGPVDWVYFNSYWMLKELSYKPVQFNCELSEGKINTSNISHRLPTNARWDSWVGPKENWNFIKQLIELYPNRKQIFGCGYNITHAEIKLTPNNI